MTVLGDALALAAASPSASSGRKGFEYGWVRGAGSVAFIAGTLIAGQAVRRFGLGAMIAMQAALLGATALFGRVIPELSRERSTPTPVNQARANGLLVLFRIPQFRNLLIAMSLIFGSHVMQDGFAVIRWKAAGIAADNVSMLWSEGVAAEVLVFFVIGPRLVTRLSPAGALALAATAGAVRWTVMAQTTSLFALALVQPLHGITFALVHLACMRVITRTAPQGLEGTAQAMYAAGGGVSSVLLMFVAGKIYARVEASGFLFMAALCLLALPLAWRLREDRRRDSSPSLTVTVTVPVPVAPRR
jgi:PPP family 3-phenylpropionic acid transporter